MLLLAHDEDDGGGMSDQQVRDEALTLFLAGHETTAQALTWTWYPLSQNPECERKMHEEIQSVLGDREPSFEDLPQLRYTEMVWPRPCGSIRRLGELGVRRSKRVRLAVMNCPKAGSRL